MKTLKTGLLLFALLSATTFFTSCKKETVQPNVEDEKEQVENVRDLAVGTYDYTVEFYALENGQLTYTGSEYDETGVVTVEAEQGVNASFEVFENGTSLFRGVGVKENGVGFSFYIPGQEHQDGELTLSIKGYPHFEMAGEKLEGLYRTDAKELRAALEAELDGVSVIMIFRGFKQ